MKAAIIPPSALIEDLGGLSDYHLILCHKVLGSDEYAEAYRELSAQGHFVILDNSAHENTVGESAKQLTRAAHQICPAEIVLPDKLFDGRTTVDISQDAYIDLRSLNIPFMSVPQGRTFDEWEWCLKQIGPLAHTIGISKDFEIWTGGLTRLVETVERAFPEHSIHLLGWGRQLGWVKSIRDHESIRGIDSAKPLVYAFYGTDLSQYDLIDQPPRYPSRPENYFNLKPEDFDMELVCSNIRVYQNLVGVDPALSILTSTSWDREPRDTSPSSERPQAETN